MRAFFYIFWRKLGDEMLNFLFPVECMGCGSAEDWMCAKCLGTIPRVTRLTCFTCRKPTMDGRFCDECGKGRALCGVWAAAFYNSQFLQKAIHAMKYYVQAVFSSPLAGVLAQFFIQWRFLFSAPIVFIPVPLHGKKMRERGYNQSHLLVADFLAQTGSGTCGCWLLRRVKHTKPQVDCTRDERLGNVANAFAYAGPRNIVRQRMVLVDDVATTGATLEACAVALQNAGLQDVWAFVLAKG